MGRIFHLATESDWRAAQATGSYTTSTRGRTLAEEGFIHASRADQWQRVRDQRYSDVAEPLVLLVIDTQRLEAPVIEETPPSSSESFPHVYGPVNLTSVVQAVPLTDDEQAVPGRDTFSSVFLREMFRNATLGVLLMALVAAGVLVGRLAHPTWGPWVGLVAGALLGLGGIAADHRRRARSTS